MSAWLCSNKHIFELAKYYVDKCQSYSHERLTFQEAAEILYEENCNSLRARYSDDEFDKLNPPLSYRPTIDNIFVMAKQVNCYEYQACEHDEWESSKAFKMCQAIKEYLLRNHPDYDMAPWGID